jgi:alkylhydroperoxidase family enzyme
LAVLDYRTDDRFSAAERAALAYAETITDGNGQVPDAVFDALRPYFSDREIVELTVSIAIENFFNRINGPLGIEAQGFCALPATFGPGHGARAGLSRGSV